MEYTPQSGCEICTPFAQVPSEARCMCADGVGAILLPLKHLWSNFISSNLFYCYSYRAIFEKVLSEVRYMC